MKIPQILTLIHFNGTLMMYFNIRDKTANSLINYLRFYLFAREERLELPTPGFGDRCSTN